MDYRNLLNIPRSKSTALRYSEVFILLHATHSLIRVPTKGEVFRAVHSGVPAAQGVRLMQRIVAVKLY